MRRANDRRCNTIITRCTLENKHFHRIPGTKAIRASRIVQYFTAGRKRM